MPAEAPESRYLLIQSRETWSKSGKDCRVLTAQIGCDRVTSGRTRQAKRGLLNADRRCVAGYVSDVDLERVVAGWKRWDHDIYLIQAGETRSESGKLDCRFLAAQFSL